MSLFEKVFRIRAFVYVRFSVKGVGDEGRKVHLNTEVYASAFEDGSEVNHAVCGGCGEVFFLGDESQGVEVFGDVAGYFGVFDDGGAGASVVGEEFGCGAAVEVCVFCPFCGGGDFDGGHVVYAVDEVQVFHGGGFPS